MLSAAPPSSTFAAHQQKQYHIRGWFDLLTDVLVGPGDSPQVDKKKPEYALICAKCHSHNGLVPEGGVRECSRFSVFFERGEVFGGSVGGCVGGASSTCEQRPWMRVHVGDACACGYCYLHGVRLGSSAVAVTVRV
jgi:hypothetical protein